MVQLKKIPAVFVEDGEMGCKQDLLCPDGPPGGLGQARSQLLHLGFLVDAKAPGNSPQEAEGMNLSLPGKPHRPCHRDGEGSLFGKLGGEAQLPESGHLLPDLVPVPGGVNKGVPLLKVTAQLLAKGPVPLHRLLVGPEVEAGLGKAKLPEQPPVKEAVLGGHFGRGVAGDAAADAVRLHQGVIRPLTIQEIGAKQAGDASAHNKDLGFQVPFQGREPGQVRRLFPD